MDFQKPEFVLGDLIEKSKKLLERRNFVVELYTLPEGNAQGWSPHVYATKDGRKLALDIRYDLNIPDEVLARIKLTKTNNPDIEVGLIIPEEASLDRNSFGKAYALGLSFYNLKANALNEVIPFSSEDRPIPEPRDIYAISPDEDYANIFAYRKVLRDAKGFIYYLDRYYQKRNLEILFEEINNGEVREVREIKIITCPYWTDKSFKSDFAKFAKNLRRFKISAELRVICDAEIERRMLHARYMISLSGTWSMVPIGVIDMGQLDELRLTADRKIYFLRLWKNGGDLFKKWDVINNEVVRRASKSQGS